MNNNVPRRGRPPTSSIEQRIQEGMLSNSSVKCHMCQRVFPRMKSLRAHYKCHTGETPYECDYPGCDAAFKQSGHLRSHLFRHTGEKPFKCKIEGCETSFTHANRHCREHDPLKQMKLGRNKNSTIDVNMNNLTEDQRQWLLRYKDRKFNRPYRQTNSNNNPSDSRLTNSNNNPSDSRLTNRNNNPRDYSYMNRNNNQQGTKRPAENNSDEENIPVNKKTGYRDDGYNSAGSESPFSSPAHKSAESDTGSDSSCLDESFKAATSVIYYWQLRAAEKKKQLHISPN